MKGIKDHNMSPLPPEGARIPGKPAVTLNAGPGTARRIQIKLQHGKTVKTQISIILLK